MNWLDKLCAVFYDKEMLTAAQVSDRSGMSVITANCGLSQLVKAKRLWRIGRGVYSRVKQPMPLSALEEYVLAAFGPHSFVTARWLHKQVPMSSPAFKKVMGGLLKKQAIFQFQRGVYTIKSPLKGGCVLHDCEIQDTL